MKCLFVPPLDLCPLDIGIGVKNYFPLSRVDTIVTSNQYRAFFTYNFLVQLGGLIFEVEVGEFLVFFCKGGCTWRIVWQWC
jgi:hypothetical protein